MVEYTSKLHRLELVTLTIGVRLIERKLESKNVVLTLLTLRSKLKRYSTSWGFIYIFEMVKIE